MKVQVQIKSTTGKVFETKEYDFDKKVDKVIVTIDSGAVMKTGQDLGFVMSQISQVMDMFIGQDMPLLVIPEFIKVEFVKLEKEENENGKKEEGSDVDSGASN
jgi:hypothetical protein